MASIPNVETLSVIAGFGGWAGAYHALSVYSDDGPIMVDRALKILALPVIWSAGSILGFVAGISVLNTAIFVYGSMFRPVPFLVNALIMSGIFITFSTFKAIQAAFKASAEGLAEELAADAAAAAAANAESDTESDEDEEEEEGGGNEDTESDTGSVPPLPPSSEEEEEDALTEPPLITSAIPISPVRSPTPVEAEELVVEPVALVPLVELVEPVALAPPVESSAADAADAADAAV
jgi:hypothetical protein